MVTVLEQLNKVLEYKVLIKAVLGYTFSCIVLHLIMNQLIIWLGFENSFFKPNLAEILKPVIETIQNQEILWLEGWKTKKIVKNERYLSSVNFIYFW